MSKRNPTAPPAIAATRSLSPLYEMEKIEIWKQNLIVILIRII